MSGESNASTYRSPPFPFQTSDPLPYDTKYSCPSTVAAVLPRAL